MGVFFDSLIMDLATFASIIVGLLYYYLTSTYSYWEKKNVPFIPPELFFGNMKDMMTFKVSPPEKTLEFYNHFKSLGHKYGGIYQLRQPVLVLCHPDIVKDILVKNFSKFPGRGFPYDEDFDPLSAHLLSLDGPKWKLMRSKLIPAFSIAKLKNLFEIMKQVTSRLDNLLEKAAEEGTMLEMRDVCGSFTTDVIIACAFGLEVHSLTEANEEFRQRGKEAFESSKTEKILQVVRSVYPWMYKLFKLRMFSKETTDFFRGVIVDTIKRREENKIERFDMLHYLMQVQKGAKGANLKYAEEMKDVENYNTSVDENALEFNDTVITATAFAFFLAGFETTASTLSSCFYELALHPEIQEKIRDEAEAVIKKHGGLTFEAFQNLKYTEQVLDETLRKHPPAPLVLRKCAAPYQLPDSDAIIDPGTLVFLSIYSFHHDPEYFPEPEKFDPDRFSEENKKKIPPFVFAPFGAGPRICLGLKFSMMEMKEALAHVILKYKVVPCEKTVPFVIDPRSFFLHPVDGLWLRFEKRETETKL